MVRNRVTCTFCGRRYRLDRLRFVGQEGGVWLYMAACGRCRAVALIGVVLKDGQPMVRDVTPKEWKHFADEPPVSADDVLDMHLLLESFTGDLASLLHSGDAGAEG